jgi:hypothetical protein
MSRTRHVAVRSIGHTVAGQIGEHVAAAAILQQGWGVAMATQDSVDLVAWNKDTGQRLLIQVKSSQLSRGNVSKLEFQLGLGGNKRLPTRYDFDIMALVSSEQRACYFLPVTAIRQKKMNRQPEFFENPELEADSWLKSIEELYYEPTEQTTLRNNRHRSRASSDS